MLVGSFFSPEPNLPVLDVYGQASGEVFCPQRRAHVAILRCADYQQTVGCHVNCPNAATKAQIAEVRSELNGNDAEKNAVSTYGISNGGGQLKDSPAIGGGKITTTLGHAKRSKDMTKGQKPVAQKKLTGKSPVTWSSSPVLKMLREQLRVWEAKLAREDKEIARLARAETEASRSKLVIDHFKATIEALTSPPASHSGQTASGKNIGSGFRNGTGGGHAKETLAEADVKLKRTEKYGSMPINDAVKEILAAAGEPLHYDDMAPLIFEIHNKTDLVRAKSCLSSRISKGIKQKVFKAAGGGRFTVQT